jgi:hypothetical protein
VPADATQAAQPLSGEPAVIICFNCPKARLWGCGAGGRPFYAQACGTHHQTAPGRPARILLESVAVHSRPTIQITEPTSTAQHAAARASTAINRRAYFLSTSRCRGPVRSSMRASRSGGPRGARPRRRPQLPPVSQRPVPNGCRSPVFPHERRRTARRRSSERALLNLVFDGSGAFDAGATALVLVALTSIIAPTVSRGRQLQQPSDADTFGFLGKCHRAQNTNKPAARVPDGCPLYYAAPFTKKTRRAFIGCGFRTAAHAESSWVRPNVWRQQRARRGRMGESGHDGRPSDDGCRQN